LRSVLLTPRFASFIDRSTPLYDILLSLHSNEVLPNERSVMYSDFSTNSITGTFESLNTLEFVSLLRGKSPLPARFEIPPLAEKVDVIIQPKKLSW
jgi:hypothetical protein